LLLNTIRSFNPADTLFAEKLLCRSMGSLDV
jgi:hypothetical protein